MGNHFPIIEKLLCALTYGARAEKYENLQDNLFRYGEMIRDLEKILAVNKDMILLDVGCATGKLAREMAPKVRHAYGVDVVQKMIASAKTRSGGIENVTFRKADAEELHLQFTELGKESVDAITCCYAFHHFVRPQLVLWQFNRLLKRKTKAVVVEMLASGHKQVDRFFMHLSRMEDKSHPKTYPMTYTAKKWSRIAKTFGFETKIKKSDIELEITENIFTDWIRGGGGWEKDVRRYKEELTNAATDPELKDVKESFEVGIDEGGRVSFKLFPHYIILKKKKNIPLGDVREHFKEEYEVDVATGE
jgi:ubiquinone/menaquinone biosynthesis C-methylase UbiE